ncbi:hypothetical protein [Actinomadura rupiterrae]|uniref:hypothetical protein n=1 Tax=Actinomadura rupiterrae TaxID=559627 RepID=UPI0020A4CF33|nr:hypothetical protein [Actinomadura rupiterrae]MCP2337633.1 hypothetical protein [Actinomadura rupiterrae]
MDILRSHWSAGPAAGSAGPLLVSLTEFTADRALDLPGIARAGLRLRRGWPELDGAVGLWLWTAPLRRTVGSVSVWTDEASLRAFVGWRPHVEIMRHYRRRGRIRTESWTVESLDLPQIWRTARRQLPLAAADMAGSMRSGRGDGL